MDELEKEDETLHFAGIDSIEKEIDEAKKYVR